MAIDLNSSQATEYIKVLKETKYVHPDTKTSIAQSVNYSKVIDIVSPTITKNKEGTNRLLAYYVARYNQVTKIITTIEAAILAQDVETEYNTFTDYTLSTLGTSTDMDSVAGLIHSSLDLTVARLRELRREQKVLSKTMAKLSNVVNDYSTIEATFTTLKTKLA